MSIIAATDLSENSRPSLRYAAAFAEMLGERLVVVNVIELWGRDMSRILKDFDDADIRPSDDAVANLEMFVTETLGTDHDARSKVIVGHPPVERLLAVAHEEEASAIVAGTSGQSKVSEAFFGSTISALARQSNIPVLAVPPGARPGPFRSILAPVDFSPCSEESLKMAARIAAGFDSTLWVMHAAPFSVPTLAPPIAYVPQSAKEVSNAVRERLEELLERHGLTERAEILVDLGPPHTAIHQAIDEQRVDLVVMGTHGRRGVAKFFLGSTAERVLRERNCPVMILRDSSDAEA